MNLLFGTPNTNQTIKILLLGSGELGKEIAIEAQRLGIEVVAVDKYNDAPAMQVAHKKQVINMQNYNELYSLIKHENPTFIIPEIEAIATDALISLEQQGFNVVPSANAVNITMDRKKIRLLVSDELDIKTTPYQFVDNYNDYTNCIKQLKLPIVIKPIMSSSGKGQSIIKKESDIKHAWDNAFSQSRGTSNSVIIEKFLPFDFEITLLTIQHKDGVSFCDPIGHIQKDGDYRTSWQPYLLSQNILKKAQDIAKKVTKALGGHGLFGVELFIKDNDVFFNEVSPRPHDTGMVTMISQELSEFELHLRAILGLPIPKHINSKASASEAILLTGESLSPSYTGIELALQEPSTKIRLFGKPTINGKRRMGVTLAKGINIEDAIEKAKKSAKQIQLNS